MQTCWALFFPGIICFICVVGKSIWDEGAFSLLSLFIKQKQIFVLKWKQKETKTFYNTTKSEKGGKSGRFCWTCKFPMTAVGLSVCFNFRKGPEVHDPIRALVFFFGFTFCQENNYMAQQYIYLTSMDWANTIFDEAKLEMKCFFISKRFFPVSGFFWLLMRHKFLENGCIAHKRDLFTCRGVQLVLPRGGRK